MTSEAKMDFKKIKDAINMLGREDMRNPCKKVGDNPKAVAETLLLIESLCDVIRQQESLNMFDMVCR